jgi:hypothetical protein
MLTVIAVILIFAVGLFQQTETYRRQIVKSLEKAHAGGHTPFDCQFDEQGKLIELPWYLR